MSANQNEDINFKSDDIKKKNLDFNVNQQKPAKDKLTEFNKKVSNSAPIRGRNKYITLGVVLLVLALAITLPIVVPRILELAGPTPDQIAEEESIRKERRRETTALLEDLDPNASEETKSAVLSDLDSKIADSVTEDEAQFYMSGKAFALSAYSDYHQAADELKSLIDEYRSSKMFTDLARTYDWASYLYEDAGDFKLALEYAKSALGTVDEAASDPEKPQAIAGRDYYQSHVNALEGKQ